MDGFNADALRGNVAKWKCNYCGETEGVISGVCPNCGPTQTYPVDDLAKEEAGVAAAEKEKQRKIKNGTWGKPETKILKL